jgi:tetratricopeptide (TPR) repeat protein
LGQQAALDEIARLEAQMGDDPSASAFPALAEANRRAGQAKEAERVAREGLRERPSFVAGRVALSLALLDLGHVDEARAELIQVLETIPDHALAENALRHAASRGYAAIEEQEETSGPLSDLAEDELENAFQDAEAQSDEMLSASHVVAAAVRGVEQDGPEGVMPFPADSSFATETVASLLEQQDHLGEAQAMREVFRAPAASLTLDTEPDVSLPDTVNDRARLIATLERWLENLRRGSR